MVAQAMYLPRLVSCAVLVPVVTVCTIGSGRVLFSVWVAISRLPCASMVD
ncbi:hypothetical protein GO283_03972 [Ralstonia solanacearum]|nr:hypothetical protein [Ralstonia solanacearum]NKA16311.1 hypothetical protein [Ralstonia solanacearum]NKA95434.1 hypothetical protein [Ralstonia solanacearum]NKB15635.1 hypothetical protein [Ralstonia solanacearum]NKF77726.1 hypothetical protein [Ralstonia solanacearum]